MITHYERWEEGISAMREDMFTMFATRWSIRSGRNVLTMLNWLTTFT